MKERINAELRKIEQDHGVTIIYACESGSRAWGFASRNSDYDARFLYARPRDHYLSIHEERDVIEVPIEDDLDLNGWDIKKALRLLRKSNPPLQEWLSSPIVYRDASEATAELRRLAARAFMQESSCHHYLALAGKSYKKIADKPETGIKPCLYALRAVLCCRWIIKHAAQPPMLITQLLDELVTDTQLRAHIDDIIAIKKQGYESGTMPRSSLLDKYLAESLIQLERKIPKNPAKPEVEAFNRVFRMIIETV
jgi:predicted nucleotidyltransferase